MCHQYKHEQHDSEHFDIVGLGITQETVAHVSHKPASLETILKLD